MASYRTLQDAIERGRGVERSFHCPVHEDRNASASVNVIKGLWICYSCGAKGTTEGIIESDDNEHLVEDINQLLAEQSYYPEAWLDQFDAGPVHPYWLSRFKIETCRWFRFGYDWESRSPCYPMRDSNNRVVGIVRRVDEPGTKYKYPFGSKRSEYLFNHDRFGHQTVYLAESATTVAYGHEAGFKIYGTYGAQYSEHQARLLECNAPNLIIVAHDNDHSGRKLLEQVQARHVCEVRGIDWSGYSDNVSDLGDIPIGHRKDLLDPTRDMG